MSKSTVVFSTDQICVDARVPWTDSNGNKACPEMVKFSNALEELEQAEKELKELGEARRCDEIIIEQLKHKKEKAEAELSTKSLQCERHKEGRYQIEQECMKLTKENHDLKAEVEMYKKFINDLDEQRMCHGHGAWDLFEDWKAQRGGE